MSSFPSDFVTAGYLQEINRRFLHPAGLSLHISASGELGVQDFRDTNIQPYINFDVSSAERVENVNRRLAARATTRLIELGFVIQPAPLQRLTP